MTPKFHLLTLAASLALVACNTDSMSQRDVGSPDSPGSMTHSPDQSASPWTDVDVLSNADKTFIRDAGSSGLFEINASEKAVRKATDNQIKTIGQRMIDDHTRLNKELTDFASGKGYNETPTLTAKQNGDLQRLDRVNGADFDREYIQMGLHNHRKNLAKFEYEASSANNRELRDWAAKSAPTLRQHTTMFEDRARAMGIDTAMKGGYERQPDPREPTEYRQPSNPRSGGEVDGYDGY